MMARDNTDSRKSTSSKIICFDKLSSDIAIIMNGNNYEFHHAFHVHDLSYVRNKESETKLLTMPHPITLLKRVYHDYHKLKIYVGLEQNFSKLKCVN